MMSLPVNQDDDRDEGCWDLPRADKQVPQVGLNEKSEIL